MYVSACMCICVSVWLCCLGVGTRAWAYARGINRKLEIVRETRKREGEVKVKEKRERVGREKEEGRSRGRVSLGHEGEGLSADGRAGHQADGEAAQCGRVVDPHHRLEGGADGVDVGLLAAGLSASCVQDIAAVEHQDQHVDLGGL